MPTRSSCQVPLDGPEPPEIDALSVLGGVTPGVPVSASTLPLGVSRDVVLDEVVLDEVVLDDVVSDDVVSLEVVSDDVVPEVVPEDVVSLEVESVDVVSLEVESVDVVPEDVVSLEVESVDVVPEEVVSLEVVSDEVVFVQVTSSSFGLLRSGPFSCCWPQVVSWSVVSLQVVWTPDPSVLPQPLPSLCVVVTDCAWLLPVARTPLGAMSAAPRRPATASHPAVRVNLVIFMLGPLFSLYGKSRIDDSWTINR
jgi:hypothetical protein